MTFPVFEKDPDAVINITFDWADWLDAGETIQSRTVTAPSGITLDSDSATDTSVQATLSGGTLDKSYDIECKIVTNSSPAQTEPRTLTIKMVEK